MNTTDFNWTYYFRLKQQKDFRSQRRIISRFLFLPKKIENKWRWLETAKYEQKSYLSLFFMENGTAFNILRWKDVKWIY